MEMFEKVMIKFNNSERNAFENVCSLINQIICRSEFEGESIIPFCTITDLYDTIDVLKAILDEESED